MNIISWPFYGVRERERPPKNLWLLFFIYARKFRRNGFLRFCSTSSLPVAVLVFLLQLINNHDRNHLLTSWLIDWGFGLLISSGYHRSWLVFSSIFSLFARLRLLNFVCLKLVRATMFRFNPGNPCFLGYFVTNCKNRETEWFSNGVLLFYLWTCFWFLFALSILWAVELCFSHSYDRLMLGEFNPVGMLAVFPIWN